jgi:hypothetical protein
MKICIFCNHTSPREFFQCPKCLAFNPTLVGKMPSIRHGDHQNSTASCPNCKNGLTIHSNEGWVTHHTCNVCRTFRASDKKAFLDKNLPIRLCPDLCGGSLFYEKTISAGEIQFKCETCSTRAIYNFNNYTFKINIKQNGGF